MLLKVLETARNKWPADKISSFAVVVDKICIF
jgi:hypothetical protein